MRAKLGWKVLTVMMVLNALTARADDSDSEDLVGQVTWGGETFAPRNLGSLQLNEKVFRQNAHWNRGMTFLSNGDLLLSVGSGTVKEMEFMKSTDAGTASWVKFHYVRVNSGDFQDPDRIKALAEGESRGEFWFFGGPLAVDGKDQVYFNLGSCEPNAVYQLQSFDPIKVQKLFPTESLYSLQFFPAGSNDLYMTSFSKITKVTLGDSDAQGSQPFFSMDPKRTHLFSTLLIDKDHFLATLVIMPPGPIDANTRPETMAVAFDRKLKGYYTMDIKAWGDMAIRPSDGAFFRYDADSHEVRQFVPPDFSGDAQ